MSTKKIVEKTKKKDTEKDAITDTKKMVKKIVKAKKIIKKEKKKIAQKKEKKITIASIVYPRLKNNEKYETVLAAVKKIRPDSKFDRSHYQWYKGQLKNK